MPTQYTRRPHQLALAIALALGCTGVATAQQPEPVAPARTTAAALIADLNAFAKDTDTVPLQIKKATDGTTLKLDERNDLITLNPRGSLTGLLDGGAGQNVLQLNAAKGGNLGDTRQFQRLDVNQGPWTLKGSGDFSEAVLIRPKAALTNNGHIEGRAIVQGSLINNGLIVGNVEVDKMGTFSGKGHVGSMDVLGELVVNHLHGAPTVAGDLKLFDKAVLAYEINAAGRGETIKVEGTASVEGAILKVLAIDGEYPQLGQYTVIEANAIDGEFARVENNLAFMKPDVEYKGTTVELTYARNDVTFEELAVTENGRKLGDSIIESNDSTPPQSLPREEPADTVVNNQPVNTLAPEPDAIPAKTIESPTAPQAPTGSKTASAPPALPAAPTSTANKSKPSSPTNAAVVALLGADKTTASHAIEQLAAGTTANLAKATLNSDGPVSATMLAAMRQFDNASGVSSQKGAPRRAAGDDHDGRVWLQALGHGGTLDRDFDALKYATQGLALGADWALDDEWRIGVMGGKSQTRLDSRDLDGDLDSWHLGAYALRQSGHMSWRFGASHSHHDGSTQRRVAFNGFRDRPQGRYDASTQQAFAEAGYNIGRANVSIEPFAGFGFQRYQRNSYTEKGGAAALKVDEQSQNNLSSTFGLRVAKLNTLDNGMQLTPRLSARWKHTYGEVTTQTRQRLITGGRNYTVSGAPLDRDSWSVDAGLDVQLSARHTLGMGYGGEFSSDSRSHGVTGQWRMTF
ncbi:autotransporter outer membrane beta-barrel domain-containing protein [Pseudomonas sp. NFX15]|uniref:autotransporter outer membrane beta-barrel domain-containing protein n=1 Tax=Pseudomonas sp. NFX15 TaxID=2816958 RepID=UPI003B8CEAF7